MNREKSNLKRRFIRGTFWGFLASLINKFGGLLFAIILARYLMPESYGIYITVLSTAMIFSSFTDLGINTTAVRYLSASIKKSPASLNSLYRYVFWWKILLSSAVSLLLIILAYPMSYYVFGNPDMVQLFFFASFYVLIYSINNFYSKIFYAMEKINYISIKETIIQISRTLLAFLLFYTVSSQFNLVGVFILLIIVYMGATGYLLIKMRQIFPNIFKKTKFDVDRKKIRNFVMFSSIAGLSSIFFSYTDAVILGIFLPSEYVAYYKTAFALVLGIVGLIGAPTSLLLPILAKTNREDSEKIIYKILRYGIIFSIPASFGLSIFAAYFLKLLYGPEYIPGAFSLHFLAFLILPIIIINIFSPLFSARDKPQVIAKLAILASVLNIVLDFILIKYLSSISLIYGTLGAAVAALISWGAYSLLMIFFSDGGVKVWRKVGSVLITSILASAIMSGVVIYILSLINEITILSGALIVLGGATIYLSLMLLFGSLKREDFEIIRLIRR
jgi:O-antigen/teichoic acid export membrane protein